VNDPDTAQKLLDLLALAQAEHPEPEPPAERRSPDGESIMQEYLRSFLTWEASGAKAEQALKRIQHAVVDLNELRVCLTDELAQMLGERYPLARERAQRLRASLNELYRREHGVTLEAVVMMPKREARAYIGSLEGVPPFVAARVTLLSLGGHAFPIDERLRSALADAGVESTDAESLGGWIERQVRGGEARQAYLALEAWHDAGGHRRAAAARRGAAEDKSPRKSKRA
jgi:hypothetical protein